MKSKPTPPEKPKVTVTRPVATVEIVIQGTTHKMSEDEAKELHAKLTTALGITTPSLKDLHDRYREPARWTPPAYMTPLPRLPHSIPDVTCIIPR